MTPEVVFATSPAVTVAIASVVSLLAGTGVVALLVPQAAKFVLPKPKETHLADFIPFESLEADGSTVRCKDGTLCQFVEIAGIDQNFLHLNEVMVLTDARKRAYDSLTEYGITLRIFTLRDLVVPPTTGEYPNPIAQEVARRWNNSFEKAYRTRTVICLSLKPGRDPNKLGEGRQLLESILDSYTPKMLSQNPDHSPTKDWTLGAFLGRIVSPVGRPNPRWFGNSLADVLCSDEVIFLKNGLIKFRNGDEEKFCSVLGLRKLGDDVNVQMANELTALPGEVVITQTIVPQAKAETMIKLKQQQRMIASSSFSSEVYTQYEIAIQLVEGLSDNNSSLCSFSEVVFLYGTTQEEVNDLEKKCRQILNTHGVTAVREKGASQASWFSQFPTYDQRPRVYRLMSANVAMMTTFDRPPAGLPRSDWGPGPIAMFHTGSNTVYSHQFHISTDAAAVGHGLCIAPTGSGKTVLMEFLSAMSSRHKNLQHYFFDRHQGTYVYTTLMGGKYLSLNAEKFPLSVRGGMNPLQCDGTDEDMEFLKGWLQAITGTTGDFEAIEQISQALEIGFETLGRDERSLAKIYDAAFTSGTRVQKELQKWVDPKQYGTMFNADEDCIDLENNWLTTFDMTKLLDDPLLAAASVSYIMERIRKTMRKNVAPGFIFIDETEPLLRNDDFKKMYLVMLQEFRKISGVIISVFQRPEALRASGISQAVRSQCSTYYLFPNPAANAADYEEFELTEPELAYILGQNKFSRRSKRTMLIKRPTTRESVIVDVDLSVPLGPYLRIFSSSSRDVALAAEIQTQYGSGWSQRYIDHEAP